MLWLRLNVKLITCLFVSMVMRSPLLFLGVLVMASSLSQSSPTFILMPWSWERRKFPMSLHVLAPS